MKSRVRISFVVLILFFIASPSLHAEDTAFFSSAKARLLFDQDLQGLGRDFSSVTYAPSKGHYFILDDSCRIFEIVVKRDSIASTRTVRLKGFKDCEAITHLPFQSASGTIRLAVTEEGKGTFSVFDLPDNATSITRSQTQVYFVARMGDHFLNDNTGLEAMAAEQGSAQDAPVFYFGREEFPRAIYRGVLTNSKEWAVSSPWDAEKMLPAKSDIAELNLFEGKLIVLDQRGSTLRQVDPQTGKILSEFQLPLTQRPQNLYEGVSIFRKQAGIYQMMVVAEKRRVLFYEIKKS